MSKRTYIQRFGKKLVKRDGLTCHYCKKELVPLNVTSNNPEYFYLQGYEQLPDGSVKAHWRTRPQYGYPSVDHIMIRKDGGTDDLDNLVLACWQCNTERNTMPYAEFKALIESRPKGYPHCSMCGTWYATTNYCSGMICHKCAEKLS